MKVKSAFVNGKEYNGTVRMTGRSFRKLYIVKGRVCSGAEELRKELGVPTKLFERMLKSGISLDLLWDYTHGKVSKKEGLKLSKQLDVDFRVELIDDDGSTKVFFKKKDLADFVGIKEMTLSNRLKRGWVLEDALSLPIKTCSNYKKSSRSTSIVYDGWVYSSISDFSKYFGYNYQLFSYGEYFYQPESKREAWLKDRMTKRHPNTERDLSITRTRVEDTGIQLNVG